MRTPSVIDTGNVVELHGVHLHRETRKALYVDVPQLGRAEWFPRSHVVRSDFDNAYLAVTGWIWDRKVEGSR